MSNIVCYQWDIVRKGTSDSLIYSSVVTKTKPFLFFIYLFFNPKIKEFRWKPTRVWKIKTNKRGKNNNS